MAENPQDRYDPAPEPAGQPAAPQPRVDWAAPQAPAGQGSDAPLWSAPIWGAPAPKPAPGTGPAARTSPLKKGLVAAGVAVVLAAGAGAAVYAANGSSGDAASAQGPGLGQDGQSGGPEGSTDGQMDRQLGGPMGQGGMGGPGDLGLGAAAGALHGEYVVQDDGGYATMATQSGTVAAAGDGMVTVESADGFKQTYTLADATVVSAGGFGRGREQTQQGTLDSGALATGQTVRVTALKDGSALTATLVLVLETGTDSSGTGGAGTDSSTGTTS
jgi:hypothetical protein